MKTPAQCMRELRARRVQQGLHEVRGIYARKGQHALIKKAAQFEMQSMTFNEWVKIQNPKYQPNDDSVDLRMLRACWDASQKNANALLFDVRKLLKRTPKVTRDMYVGSDRKPWGVQAAELLARLSGSM